MFVWCFFSFSLQLSLVSIHFGTFFTFLILLRFRWGNVLVCGDESVSAKVMNVWPKMSNKKKTIWISTLCVH